MAANEFLTVGDHKYELSHVLGVGGFSEVRKATQEQSGRRVALKLLYVDPDANKRDQDMQKNQVAKEIKGMRNLTHVNIIKLVGWDLACTVGDRKAYVLVQELAPNGELFDYLMYTNCFPEKMARSLFHQLIDGLGYMHSKGIAHRDLKPENLLFDANFNLKIADFGFSYQFRKGEGDKSKMRTELGTKGYMAPEIIQNKKYDEKTDIFAAGVILFICLAGFPPFQNAVQADWWFDKLMSHKYKLFWMAHERTSKFSDSAKDIIQRMLEPKPSARVDVNGVKDTKWFKEEKYDKPKLQKELAKRLNKVKEEKQKATSRDVYGNFIKDYNLNERAKGDKLPLQLRPFVENRYRTALGAVTNEKQFLSVIDQFKAESNKLKSFFEEQQDAILKRIKENNFDIADVGKSLENVESEEDIANVLGLHAKADSHNVSHMFKLMEENIFDVEEMPDTFCEFDEFKLPVWEKNKPLGEDSIHTYKIDCTLGLLLFAVDRFSNTYPSQEREEQCQYKLYPKQGTIQIVLEYDEDYQIPEENEDGSISMVDVQLEKELTISLKAYSHPKESYNILVITKGDNSPTTIQKYRDCVQALLTKTLLDSVIIKS